MVLVRGACPLLDSVSGVGRGACPLLDSVSGVGKGGLSIVGQREWCW